MAVPENKSWVNGLPPGEMSETLPFELSKIGEGPRGMKYHTKELLSSPGQRGHLRLTFWLYSGFWRTSWWCIAASSSRWAMQVDRPSEVAALFDDDPAANSTSSPHTCSGCLRPSMGDSKRKVDMINNVNIRAFEETAPVSQVGSIISFEMPISWGMRSSQLNVGCRLEFFPCLWTSNVIGMAWLFQTLMENPKNHSCATFELGHFSLVYSFLSLMVLLNSFEFLLKKWYIIYDLSLLNVCFIVLLFPPLLCCAIFAFSSTLDPSSHCVS